MNSKLLLVWTIANCYDRRMLNIRTIRKSNLLAQIARFDSQRAFADRAGLVPTHVSQMVTGRRNMGDEVARRIERKLALPEGYMDIQHKSQSHGQSYPLGNGFAGRSQVAESDLEKLLLSAHRMKQTLSPKTQEVVAKIERAAMDGKLADEDWETLERLVERFEKDA